MFSLPEFKKTAVLGGKSRGAEPDTGCYLTFYPIGGQGLILDRMKILTLLGPSEFLEYLGKAK